MQIFLHAIGANWLVCFAVYISISSREIVSKIVAIWWPTFTFVALGLDHVIVGLYIWKSMIPTALGNTLGGELFVGGMYWYLYLTGPESEDIKFNVGDLDSAMEAGGPIGPSIRKSGPNTPNSQEEKDETFTKGKEPGRGHPNHVDSLPSSDQQLASGLGRELSAEAYTHRKGEPSLIEDRAV